MSSPKTKPTAVSVEKFLAGVKDAETRQDCQTLVDIIQSITGEPPQMWGPSIVGFGTYRYVYASGREGDWPLAGFSPRKRNISLYLSCEISRHQELLDQLGPHDCGKGCLYIKRLSDVHLPTLKKLIKAAIKDTKRLVAEMAKQKPLRKSHSPVKSAPAPARKTN